MAGRIGDINVDRKNKTRELKAQIQKWENDKMYAPEHIKQQVDTLKAQLSTVNREYQEKINQAVKDAKLSSKKRMCVEPELNFVQEMKLLRLHMINKDKTAELIETFKSPIYHNDLYNRALEAIETEAADAPAFVAALKKLRPDDQIVKDTVDKYQESLLTPDQLKGKADLAAVEEKFRVVQIELYQEQLAEGNLTPIESISIKGRLQELNNQAGA